MTGDVGQEGAIRATAKGGIKVDSQGDWACDAGDIGAVENYDVFNPLKWFDSGRYTSINGQVLPTFAGARAGKFERWRMIHGGVGDTINLEFRAQTSPVDITRLRASDSAALSEQACAGAPVPQYVIAADGMWSPTRKALGIAQPGYRGEWHAFRQYFKNVSPRASSELIVWFEPDLLPGYAWSFPLADGTANIGFGILRDDSSYKVSDMGPLWRELLARPHVREFLGPDAEPESPHRAWPIPARVDRIALSCERTLFVGDAAAATDPMTGEGIGQALLTGRWAAEAIISNPTNVTACASAYEHSVETELSVDHRFAERLMTILRRPLGARGAVRIAGMNGWTRRNFGRWLFEDYPRGLLLTPRRWHRGMLTGPGAYRGSHANSAD